MDSPETSSWVSSSAEANRPNCRHPAASHTGSCSKSARAMSLRCVISSATCRSFSGVEINLFCLASGFPGLAKRVMNSPAIRQAGHNTSMGESLPSCSVAAGISTRFCNCSNSRLPSSSSSINGPGSTASSADATPPVTVGQIFSPHKRVLPSSKPVRDWLGKLRSRSFFSSTSN